MAPKKKAHNGYSVFMMETRQKLMSQGAKVSMADMSEYCKKDWENMSQEMKEKYKIKGKQMKNDGKVAKYSSIGENLEDVQKKLDEHESQANAMYAYIDVLLDMQPASHYLPKQKFILIHINSYSCEKEGFYFPAEISMAEFSLEKGLIRMFHQLIGFDQVRTNAPRAPTADINNHAANYHKINVFSMFPNNYTDVLLKMIGFIMQKDVDETVLDDLTLDMPPVYTAHTPIGNELMITSASLFKLFESAVRDAERSDFNNIIRVYHLDKLFMNLKNACFKVKHPGKSELALPSVGMATDSLSKDVLSTMITVGCDFHEKLDNIHVCSSYVVCKWIHILSAHCCRYFDIELVSGCHFDFDLSKTVEEHFGKMNISKFPVDNSNNKKINKPLIVEDIKIPPFEGGCLTSIQKRISNIPELKSNTNSEIMTDNKDNFLGIGNLKNIQKDAPGAVMNNLRENAVRGRGVLSHFRSHNRNQLNESPKQPSKGRGFISRSQ